MRGVQVKPGNLHMQRKCNMQKVRMTSSISGSANKCAQPMCIGASASKQPARPTAYI